MLNKKSKIIQSLSALSLLLIVSIAPTRAQGEIDIGEVVIEGESVKSALLLRRESVSGKYIIPRADLAGFGYSTAGDVIKNLPLVYIDGDPGVNRNMSISGLAREYQSILINGKIPAGGEDSRDLKLDRIPIGMIERIEIDYNGPVSAGTGGIGGTLNIILKDKSDKSGFLAHLASNINTTHPKPGIKAEVEGSGTVGKLDFYGGLTYNSYERLKLSKLLDSSTGIKGDIEELIVTEMAGLNMAASLPVSEYSELDLKGFFSWFNEDEYEYAEVKRRKDGTLNIRESDTDNDKLRYLLTSDLEYRFKKGYNNISLSAGFSNNYEKRHKDQLQEKSDYYEEVQENEDQNNYTVAGDILYTRENIRIGAVISQFDAGVRISQNRRSTDRINATRPEGYLLWDILDESYNMNENIVSFSGKLQSKLTENIVLLPAINFEHSSGDYLTADTTGNHLFSHISPSLHLKYKVNDNLIINAAIAKHISRPAYMSMVPISKVKIKKNLIEVGNPNLIPARATAVNLSGTYYFNNSSYISGTAYYKWVKDMIQMEYGGIDGVSGYNIYKFVNIDTVGLYGFYIDTRIDFDPDRFSGFSLYLAYSYLGSKTGDKYTGGTKRIDDQPAHLVNLRLDYLNTDKRTNLSLALNYNSARIIAPLLSDEGDDIAQTTESGYFTLAARVKYFLKRSGSIYLAGDNLFMQPVVVEQGTVTEKSFPGAIIRIGINLNINGS